MVLATRSDQPRLRDPWCVREVPKTGPHGRMSEVWGNTAGVPTSSDLAVISSLTSQIEDLARRVTELAEQYGQTPDSAVATELFSAERTLTAARRSLNRATALLDQMG